MRMGRSMCRMICPLGMRSYFAKSEIVGRIGHFGSAELESCTEVSLHLRSMTPII